MRLHEEPDFDLTAHKTYPFGTGRHQFVVLSDGRVVAGREGFACPPLWNALTDGLYRLQFTVWAVFDVWECDIYA
jgi:hypothetical protein